jgi:hypothetical protein
LARQRFITARISKNILFRGELDGAMRGGGVVLFEDVDESKSARRASGNRESNSVRRIAGGEVVAPSASVTAIAHVALMRFRRDVGFTGPRAAGAGVSVAQRKAR